MDSPDSKLPVGVRNPGMKETFTETIQTPGRLLKIISADNRKYAVSYPVEATFNVTREKPEFAPPEELVRAKSMFYSDADPEGKRAALALQREGLRKLDEQIRMLQNKSLWPEKQNEVDDIESTGRGSYFSYDLNGDSSSSEEWQPTNLAYTDNENPGSEGGVDPKGSLRLVVLVTKGQIFINEATEAVSLKDLVVAGIMAFKIGDQLPDRIVSLVNDVCTRLEAKDHFGQIRQSGNKNVDPAKITPEWMSSLSKVIKQYDQFRETKIIT